MFRFFLKNAKGKLFAGLMLSLVFLLTGCVNSNVLFGVAGKDVAVSAITIQLDLSSNDNFNDLTAEETERQLKELVEQSLESNNQVEIVVEEQDGIYEVSAISPPVKLEDGTNEILLGEVNVDSFDILLEVEPVPFALSFLEGLGGNDADILSLNFAVELPTKISTATNSGRIFDNTVRWNKEALFSSEESLGAFAATSSLIPELDMVTIVIIIVGFVLFLASIFLLVRRKMRKRPKKIKPQKPSKKLKQKRTIKQESENVASPVVLNDEIQVPTSEPEEPFGIQVKLPPLLEFHPDSKNSKKRRE